MRIINRHPGRGVALFLAALPFLALAALYATSSQERLAINPADKILPSLSQMAETMKDYTFVPDKRTGEVFLWSDTWISMWRLCTGLAISIVVSLGFGIAMGFIPWIRAMLQPFVSAFSLIPPITVLPILFIMVGLDEASKIALIFVGTAPVMLRAVALAVEEIPKELIVKAQTLGASTWQMILRLVLPQVLPKLIVAIRFALIPAWIYLVSAEAIAATSGLGYRIFLVRRFLAMDVILPYVAWITLIAWLMDTLLVMLQRRAFPWFQPEQADMSAVVLDKVWKEYGDAIVLERISLEIAPRSFVALVGPSGCGKTTLLRMLLGEERPTRGSIQVYGKPLKPEPDADRGVVFQRYSVFPHMTVLDNVLVGYEFEKSPVRARLFGAARRAARSEAEKLIAAVGLTGHESKYPAALSGGMQQRLALAQALARKPKILLLDEPFGALDPGIRGDIHALMLDLWNSSELTVIMVTHDLSEAFRLGSRVVALERSRNRAEEKARYGATISQDLEVWPKKVARHQNGSSVAIAPERPEPST